MRRVALALALVVTALAPSVASATCRLKAVDLVSSDPYFTTQMTVPPNGISPTRLELVHKDDGRMAVVFSISEPKDEPSQYSRSDYVRRIEARAAEFASVVKLRGPVALPAVFPYDPVAWRTVHQEVVSGIGPSRISHMEMQVTPDCILVADAIAPDSVNLSSRWADLQREIIGLRESAARFVVPAPFKPDRAIPTGLTALAGGVALPIAVVMVLYLLMGQIHNLDPPGVVTRLVIGCVGVTAIGAAIYQRHAYIQGWDEMRFVDGAILFAFIGLAAAFGVIRGQRSALIGLLSALIGAVTLAIASYLDWTPDRFVSLIVAGVFLTLGIAGFLSWKEATARGRRTSVVNALERQNEPG